MRIIQPEAQASEARMRAHTTHRGVRIRQFPAKPAENGNEVIEWAIATLAKQSHFAWYISSHIRDAPMHDGLAYDIAMTEKFPPIGEDPRWPDKPGILALTLAFANHPFQGVIMATYVEENHFHINIAERDDPALPHAIAFRWSVCAPHKYDGSESRMSEVRLSRATGSSNKPIKQIVYSAGGLVDIHPSAYFVWGPNQDGAHVAGFARSLHPSSPSDDFIVMKTVLH